MGFVLLDSFEAFYDDVIALIMIFALGNTKSPLYRQVVPIVQNLQFRRWNFGLTQEVFLLSRRAMRVAFVFH